MGARNKYCIWLYAGSPIGPLSVFQYQTQCGHYILCKKPLKCDFCGKPTAYGYFGSAKSIEHSQSDAPVAPPFGQKKGTKDE
jgi:hypothetical protein